jgi:precorrin-2/cobalt-factor-2 C20-methyltransferase
MKAGQARPRILAALAHTGRLADASYLENISRPQQRLVRDVTALDELAGPYFSLFVITRRERSSR